jgi:hypothetical protein
VVRAQCPLFSPWITVLNPTWNRLSGLEFLWFPFSLQARHFETGHDHYLNTNPTHNKNRMWTGVWSIPHRVEMTNNMHWLYKYFILYTGSYMFRQQAAIIRELLKSFWVTWNTNRMGGISYNVWLRGLCAGVSWFRQEQRHYCRNM